jgi:AcrR family transcriptional regulator
MQREPARTEEGYIDPRMLRSRRRLHAAVLALAAERDLVDISIGDITVRAKVNRATFYLHYREKDCLLADAMNTALTSEINASAQYGAPKAEGGQAAPRRSLVTYFRHIDRYRAVYRRALGP